ncbi:MPPV-023 ankyrin repeat protein [Magpiepox virus 2]|nr:MPPV-023 ankyrin repeat protein [Magpiepox virus 2]
MHCLITVYSQCAGNLICKPRETGILNYFFWLTSNPRFIKYSTTLLHLIHASYIKSLLL